MVNILRDANPEDGGSSNPSDATVVDPSSTDPTQQEPVEPQEPTEDPDAPSDEPVEPVDPQEPTEPQEPETPVENVTLDKPEDAQLPFHKHPRFQEVIAAKNAAVQEVEKSKPLVQQATALQDFMRTNNISSQEYQSALQYLQALRSDPVAAFKMLQPTYEQLAQFAGEVLPQDLQAEVAAGTLSLDRAKELAKSRAQSQYQQVRSQWQSQAGQQSTQSVVTQTIGVWENAKITADPDFKPGTDLYKEVDKNIRALPKFSTPEQAMAGCEQAYKEAKAFFAKYAPRQVAQRKVPLQSRHSASGNNHVVKTAADVAKFIGAGGKPHQLRYS